MAHGLRFIHWNSHHIITRNDVISVKWARRNPFNDTWIKLQNMLHLDLSGAKWQSLHSGHNMLSFSGLQATRRMGRVSWDCWPITCNRRLSIRFISPQTQGDAILNTIIGIPLRLLMFSNTIIHTCIHSQTINSLVNFDRLYHTTCEHLYFCWSGSVLRVTNQCH